MRPLIEIAAGVLVRSSDLFVTNSAVVAADGGGCLVVDPGVTPTDLRELVAELARADLTPIAGFSSHPHWDHVLWCTALGDGPRYASPRAVSTAERDRAELISSVENAAPGHDLEVFARLIPVDQADEAVPWNGPDVLIVTHDGHAPGHAALFLPDSGTLLAGDMCSDIEIPLLDLEQADPIGDYLAGLARLISLPVRLVVPGHGTVGDDAEFRRRVAADIAYLEGLQRGSEPADPRLTEPQRAQPWLLAEHQRQVSRFVTQNELPEGGPEASGESWPREPKGAAAAGLRSGLGDEGRSRLKSARRRAGNNRAVVVGSGPNGLAAALVLARAGLEVEVIEGARTPGGGCRTEELTLPGFRHDVCSAVHPLAAASPFFADADLDAGVRLLAPKVAFAHPLDGGLAAAVVGTAHQTAAGLGADENAYRRLVAPLVRNVTPIVAASLAPIRSLPRSPVAVGRFGMLALQPATRLTRRFETAEARALLAGAAAHSMLPLSQPLTAGFGLLLTILAHSTGWPVAEGGSAAIAAAMVARITSLGGTVSSGRWITRLDELPPARVVVLDITPRALVRLAGSALPASYRRALERFSYSPGVCKVDWALDGPVPWKAQACLDTVTVHIGGSAEEVRRSEDQVAAGHHSQRPFCIVAQPCVADASRAPAGKHTLWAYCHVPAGSPVDMSDRIEAQIERFAPGFRDLVLARSVRTAAQLEHHNPNYVGGDINAGAGTLRQTMLRPVPRWNPYRTPLSGIYLCSSSTSPGGGVHGMCGTWAARTALADLGVAPLRYRGGLSVPFMTTND